MLWASTEVAVPRVVGFVTVLSRHKNHQYSLQDPDAAN
jgi:hypothetical protein